MDFEDCQPECIYQSLNHDDQQLFDWLLTSPPPQRIRWQDASRFLTESLVSAAKGCIIARDDGDRLIMAFCGQQPQRIRLIRRSDGRYVSDRNIEELQYFFYMIGFEPRR